MSKEIKSPMPAKIVAVHIKAGDHVDERTEAITIESMKMEMPVQPEYEGTVSSVLVTEGQTVSSGSVLFTVD